MMNPLGYRNQNIGERRRREIARVDDMTAKDTTVSGRHLIYGLGEVQFDVKFPVSFAQRPVPHFDPELDEGQSPVAGGFPGARACVVGWDIVGRVEGATDGYFVGATIAVTVYGSTVTQLLWLHYSFHGTGLRNPIHGIPLLEEEI